jgi:hypothetical protein
MRRLKLMSASTIMVGTVHDDIRLDSPEEEVDEVVKMCYNVFDDIPKNIKRVWGIDVPLNFPGEVYKGHNFRHMELVK